MNGGYQLLTLKGLPLTSGEASNIKGAWDQVNRANGKRIVVTGLVVAGESADTAYNDFEMYFEAGVNTYEGSVTIGANIITISVDYGDDVTATVATVPSPEVQGD